MVLQFGDRIKQLREHSGMTQAELGKKIGVSDRVIGYYESNQRFPRKQEVIIKLANEFNVTVDYLMGTSDREKDPTSTVLYESSIPQSPPVQVETLISNLELLFAGGQLAEKDKDKVYQAITEIYIDSKIKDRL